MRVAVAVIVDELQHLLITQRPFHVAHGGCWEFPGGKLEVDESPECALIREVREEVGLEVVQHQYLGTIKHQYPDKSVQLEVFLVTKFRGTASCREGQLDIQWIKLSALNSKEFPEANHKVIAIINEYL